MDEARPVLLLDSAGPRAAVGVARGRDVLAAIYLEETRRHAEGLPQAVDDALAAAGVGFPDLGGVFVGRGPGSFIGVRVALAMAKGVAQALGIPLGGLPTLLALGASGLAPPGRGIAVLDARRSEVYAQAVERTAEAAHALSPPVALPPDDLARVLADPAFVVGTLEDTRGALLVPEELFPGALRLQLAGPDVGGLVRALPATAQDELHGLTPDYRRPPDAKLPGER